MARAMNFSLIVALALVALATVVRCDNDLLDSFGKAIQFFESGGDPDWRKRSFNVHNKLDHKLQSRGVEYFTTKPLDTDKFWKEGIKITWYAQHDLKNPSCGDGSWDPENSAHIGAVSAGWSEGPQCGEFVRLCNEKNHRCVRVRVIDHCEGCKNDHVDLTKSAFKRLSMTNSLDEGVTTGLKLYRSNKPNPWDKSMYGPGKLKN